MKCITIALAVLSAACVSDIITVDDSGMGLEGSSPLDAQSGETASDGGGLDHVDSPTDSSSDANALDSGAACIQTGNYCMWDPDANTYNTKCCTKKCAIVDAGQQQELRCAQ